MVVMVVALDDNGSATSSAIDAGKEP